MVRWIQPTTKKEKEWERERGVFRICHQKERHGDHCRFWWNILVGAAAAIWIVLLNLFIVYAQCSHVKTTRRTWSGYDCCHTFYGKCHIEHIRNDLVAISSTWNFLWACRESRCFCKIEHCNRWWLSGEQVNESSWSISCVCVTYDVFKRHPPRAREIMGKTFQFWMVFVLTNQTTGIWSRSKERPKIMHTHTFADPIAITTK